MNVPYNKSLREFISPFSFSGAIKNIIAHLKNATVPIMLVKGFLDDPVNFLFIQLKVSMK